MKRLVVLTALSVLFAACGESGLLDTAGDRSKDFVFGDSLPTTSTNASTVIVPAGDGKLVSTRSVAWLNDTLSDSSTGSADFVIAKVWQRRTDETRFVQASRAEIAAAVPGIFFPTAVPEDVTWVTSQLVFDLASATLDADVSAAFGLWSVDPYTSEEGRRGILRVGSSGGTTLVEGEIRPEQTDLGFVMTWVVGTYRYELFCPIPISETACRETAESSRPLANQLP